MMTDADCTPGRESRSVAASSDIHCKDIVSDIAIFVLKRDVKLQLTNCKDM